MKITSVDREKLYDALSTIVQNLKQRYPEIKDIFLFGSFARGDYTPESDIDLLIVCSHLETPFLFRSERFIEFFRPLPLDVNFLVYTEEEIHRMREEKNPFILAVFAEAKRF
ncbi:MAG: nucleotidyltransferase domain-containing protein [Atribacterota bacterium]|nr:nucleotidyltransferase domain-containing protein [Atribacterota bacterium]